MIGTDHVGWEKKPQNFAGEWDMDPVIWQNFSQLTYVTMDVEDMANGTHSLLTGVKDSQNVQWILTLVHTFSSQGKLPKCVNSRSSTETNESSTMR